MELLKKKTEIIEMESPHEDPRAEVLRGKINRITSRHAEVIDQLDDINATRRARMQEKVNALEEDRAPDLSKLPDLRELNDELPSLDRAKKSLQEQLQNTLSVIAKEIREKLTPQRQKLLTAIDRDLVSLVANLERYETFLDDAERHDLVDRDARQGYPWNFASIALGRLNPTETIEYLKKWHDEFKKTGFLHK